MKITVDTNILVRAIIADDAEQARLAQDALERATLIALPVTCLVEFCWVTQRVYKLGRSETAAAIRSLIAADKVAADRGAVEAGLALFEAGGDFADGVIAHSGKWLGGETFMSFDRQAVRLLALQGESTIIPS
ncbi:type II toxin-antitoxin system VapC family toxin [Sphingomonas sp. AP4-R1]|uniref:type II toxin-antitoxin system VapC family toxin n=1 Tax=Sphingomonas sp. AP4-R1 TaxID=2735134 RepID=UPI0014935DAF|nr:type II toxin-antitoxin system VapC family toxin [Sphingomonas sp. AP4-R1]QJU59274.1 type II toxin-antitoxin system VapC family toxin [Sphingomonas sp. AP4-R1]